MRTLLALLLLGISPLHADLPWQPTKVQPSPVPAPPFGTAGGFVVPIGDTLLAAGANDNRFLIWKTALKGGGAWEPTEVVVPKNAAHAAWGSSWVLAGGEIDGKPVGTVSLLDLVNGLPALHPLPDLPAGVVGAAAAVLSDKLYVLGGLKTPGDSSPGRELWILDLKAPKAWQHGPEFPGEPRSFPAITEQYGMLCLFGGRDANSRPLADAWVFRPTPLEGTKDSGWKRISDVPVPSAKTVALPIGQAQVLLLSETPGRTVTPFLYHTLTDAWCGLDALDGLTDPIAVPAGEKTFLLAQSDDGAKAFDFQVLRNVRTLNWIDYTVIVCYFGVISTIGILASRHQKSSADFSLAGRNVPWWVAGISMFATGASAISFMAIPALAFQTNLIFLFPILVMIPAYFVQSRVTYPLLRKMQITSTYEYLERRFNRTLRLVASAQCIVFQTFGRASVVLVLPSLAISATTGISVYFSVILMWAITTVYTAVGGFHAVVWTDVFQGTLKFFAPLAMIGLCIFRLPGGFKEFVHVGVTYHKFDFALVTWDLAVPAFWVLVISTFLTATIGQAGDQPVIQRVFSSPEHEVRRVAMMSTACGLLISFVVNVLGIAIFAYFRAHPAQLDPMAQNDKIVPLFVIQALPHGFIGVVIAAIFASAMTTVASSMNSSATVFTEDFFLRFKPDATDKLRVLVLRIGSTVVGVIALSIACLLATMNLKSIMVTWSIISALLGGGIVGVYSLGMFTTRVNGFGAVGGALASIIICLLVKLYTPLHWATYLPIAILSCMVCGYLFSLVKPQHKDLTGLTVFTPVVK
jgi:solute:Na+ symporter, SSS family